LQKKLFENKGMKTPKLGVVFASVLVVQNIGLSFPLIQDKIS